MFMYMLWYVMDYLTHSLSLCMIEHVPVHALVFHGLDFEALFVRKMLPGLAIDLIKTRYQQIISVLCI